VLYLLETFTVATARCVNCLMHSVLEEEVLIFQTIVKYLLQRAKTTDMADREKIYVAQARCALLCTATRKSMEMLKTILSFAVFEGTFPFHGQEAFGMAYVGAHLSQYECGLCETSGIDSLDHLYATWINLMWTTYYPYKTIGREHNKDVFKLAAFFTAANTEFRHNYKKYLDLLFETTEPRSVDSVGATMNVATHGEMMPISCIDGV
jgi:hypothetical protein